MVFRGYGPCFSLIGGVPGSGPNGFVSSLNTSVMSSARSPSTTVLSGEHTHFPIQYLSTHERHMRTFNHALMPVDRLPGTNGRRVKAGRDQAGVPLGDVRRFHEGGPGIRNGLRQSVAAR